jgi:hypothetical protein
VVTNENNMQTDNFFWFVISLAGVSLSSLIIIAWILVDIYRDVRELKRNRG